VGRNATFHNNRSTTLPGKAVQEQCGG